MRCLGRLLLAIVADQVLCHTYHNLLIDFSQKQFKYFSSRRQVHIYRIVIILSQTKNTELYFVFIVLAGWQAASYCFVRQAHITTPQTPRSLLTITKIITE